MKAPTSSHWPPFLLLLTFSLGVLVLDCLTSSGWAVWILYLLTLAGAYWRLRWYDKLSLAAVCTLLVVLGLWLSPPGVAVEMALTNRLMGVATFWILAFLMSRHKRVVERAGHERDLSDSIINSLPGVFYIYDENRRFLRWNRHFETVTGYSAEEMARRHPLDFFAGDDKGLLAQRINQVFTTGGGEVEADFVSRTGTRTPYYFTGVRAEIDGRPCLLGMGIDISERKRAVAALREKEEWLRLAIQASHVGLWDWDLQTNQVVFSREWKSQLGYAEDEIGNDFGEWQSRVHPDDLAPALERIQQFLARTEGGHQVEFRMRHKDGSWRWIYARAEAARAADGKPVRILGCHVDITEHKRAEAELRRLAESLEQAQRRARIGNWELNLATRRGWWSQEMYLLFGRDPASGPPSFAEFLELVHPDDRPQFTAANETRRHLGETIRVEYRSHPGQGPPRHFLSITEVTEDETGTPFLVGTTQDVTEIKQAESSLRESEERLQLFIAHAPAALAMFDRDMRYLAVSRRWLTDYGLGVGRIIGRSHYAVFPEIPPRWREAHRRGLEGEVVRAEEDHFEREDGQVQWLRWEVRPWHRNDGSVGGIVIFTEDITEQKRAEVALRESEENLRLALDAAHMGTWDWDVSGNRITWTRWHEEMWGYAPGQFPGTYEAFAERVHSEDLPGIEGEIARCIADLQPFDHEFRVVWPDGSVHWVSARGEFAFGEAGHTTRMRGVVKEITERKLAEQALRDSEERFRALIENSQDAFVLIAADGTLLYASPGSQRILGYTAEEWSGQGMFDYAYPEEVEEIQRLWADLLRRPGESVTFSARARHKNGTWRWIDATLTNQLANPVLGAVVTNYRDFTERKRAEVALQASRERLARLSRQLITAQETERRHLARELHDEIGQVLTAVHISLHQARGVCPRAAWPRLDEADRIVDRAIQEVRAMSLNLRPAMLDDFGLVPALRWLVERQQPPECPIDLEIECCGEPLSPELSNTCYRIIQEALTNVRRHARATHVRVEVVHTPEAIRLLVRDDGTGFDAEEVKRRVAVGRSFGVLGMQERAELLGGQFHLESAPGQGTTVRVQFTLSADEE